MAKIKVHELAREMGVDKKIVVSYLRDKGYDSMTAVSAVPEGEVANIRSRFGGAKPEARQPETVVSGTKTEASSNKTEQTEPKKRSKGIVRVFRSQNASTQLKSQIKALSEENTIKTETNTNNASPEKTSPKSETRKAEIKKNEDEIKNPTERPANSAGESNRPLRESPAAKADLRAEGSAQPSDRRSAGGKTGYGRGGAGTRPQDNRRDGGSGRAGQSGAGFGNRGQQGSRTGSPNGMPRQGQGQTSGRSYAKNGDNRQPYGQNRQDRSVRSPYGQDRNNRPAFGQDNRNGRSATGINGDRRGVSADRSGRSAFGQGGNRDGRSFGQNRQGVQDRTGRQPYGQNSQVRGGKGAASARPAESDGALMHKATRDYRKDSGKEYERNREERKENGKHSQYGGGNHPNQSKKQFNRIPKALQQNQPKNTEQKVQEVVTEIRLPERMTIRELAEAMKKSPAQLVKDLFMKGMMVTVNHEIPFEKAQEIAMDYDIIAEEEEKEDVIGALLAEDEEKEDEMVQRPPVVCVMGHVDHGKTSLLDAIRNTHVTDREAGGITQHIGAYMVSINGQKITFLDTPGHEAFTAMRMRGANSTDIAVLVVAADDGVMPQTVEAINHAKAANIDVIVAVNKIDKPGANIERVKQELAEKGLVPEEWGGSTIFCPVSAKTHEGIDNLLEMILLTSEMKELKANPNRKARGLVLEAKLDKGRGPVATILIQKGTLKQGDFIACGEASGKVRAMNDEKGRRLHKATPSMPVEIIGLSSVPSAGEVLVAMDSDKEAKAFAATFVSEGKKSLIEETKTQMSLDDLFNQIKEGNLKELPIVVKADVQGSVEAVRQSLVKLSNDEVVVKIIHGAVGSISESDVALASASNAIIIGFNVKPDSTAKAIADAQKVDIHLYSVIYEAIEDVERALNGMKAAVYEEKVLGHAEIRQLFKASGIGNIAGAYVKDGVFQRKCKIRVFRGEEQLYEGALSSLKRFKDDVKEVREGFECGLVFDGWDSFQVDDTVLAYTMVEVPRT
ncbi:MAG: translation initiation factor IF-2 [Lachnospiraceae bacterium]|nr:translation initiation factor IF-2 [Lachnospiraceae bacterium]